MCCFSRPIAEVSGTSIFVRLDGDRQVLAYQMHLSSAEDVAMILPLPIALGHGEKAVEFVDLSEAPRLFEELGLCFWRPTRSAGALATAAAGAAATRGPPRHGAPGPRRDPQGPRSGRVRRVVRSCGIGLRTPRRTLSASRRCARSVAGLQRLWLCGVQTEKGRRRGAPARSSFHYASY